VGKELRKREEVESGNMLFGLLDEGKEEE